MAITSAQNRELTDILSDIQTDMGSLTEKEAGFVNDQIERHEKYGLNIFMSEKQWNWLKVIRDKVMGTNSRPRPSPRQTGAYDRDAPPVDYVPDGPGDLDDEIPL